MQVKDFFDKDSFTFTYVVYDAESKDAVVIDSVLNYNPIGSTTSLSGVNEIANFLKSNELQLHYILETHAHADHLSGSQYLKEMFPLAKIGIGQRITEVQSAFAQILNMGPEFKTDGSQFDELMKENQEYQAGNLKFTTSFVPGHTPACVMYNFNSFVFTGDVVFQPDVGVGRCDFPKGSARDLYHSVQSKIYALPPETGVYVGHDYPPEGIAPRPSVSLGELMEKSGDLPKSRDEEDFVNYRTNADSTLPFPKLLYQAIQVNIAAGALPPKDTAGLRHLNIPIAEPK